VANLVDAAGAALKLAETAPKRARGVAARLARRAELAGDWKAASVAERAHGLALRHCGHLDSAVRHLRQAIAHGQRAASPQLSGEARMTLASALYEQGRTRLALAEIHAALGELEGLAAARALTQRGTLLGELGRYEEAFADYRRALPVLRTYQDRLWLYRVAANRGLAHAYRHEFGAAEADLREAERLAREEQLGLTIGFAQANLGYVLARRGDVPAALGYLDQAERCIRSYGAQVGALLADRAELLLSVRVVGEARQAAVQALAAFHRERRHLKLPEARLLLARAAFLDGDPAGAVRQAMHAARQFAEQDRPNWAALARLAALQIRSVNGRRRRVEVGQVEAVVRLLEQASQADAALEGRLLAAELLRRRGHPEPALAHLHTAGRARSHGPSASRARGWYATALLRFSTGDRPGAVRAVRAGLRVLDSHHAVLGATDLRAHAVGNRSELADLGLRMALGDGRPRRILEWLELGRAGHLLPHPVRPPEDPELADALAELRDTVATLNQEREAVTRTGALVRRQVRLERQIRDRLRQLPADCGGPPPGPVRPEALAGALADRALLEYGQLDGELHAVTLVDGRVRWHVLGELAAVRDLVERIPFALRLLIRPGLDQPSRAAALSLLRRAADRLDGLLLRPCPELADRPLVIVPTGPLQNLPWSVLPSCADRPLTVSPSATLWQAAAERVPGADGHVTVAAGPDLSGASAEARAVAAVHHTVPLLAGQATVAAVLSALNGATLAHLATHGVLSAHNQLFSRLRFADGPVLVYDIERLASAPHTVVLAACDSARSHGGTGDVLLGLTATFIAQGTAQLVASVLPVPDLETTPLMTALHTLVAAGQPPAAALTAARRMSSGDAAAVAAGASFLCWGAGFTATGAPAA
jgi:tetratricopeptide (TPR) repeat protein